MTPAKQPSDCGTMGAFARLAAIVPKLRTPLQLIGWIFLVVCFFLTKYVAPTQIHLLLGIGLVGLSFVSASLPYFFLKLFRQKDRLWLVLGMSTLAGVLLLAGLCLTGWFLFQVATATHASVGSTEPTASSTVSTLPGFANGLTAEPVSTERNAREPSRLVLTDIDDDPPPVEHIGSEIDEVVRQVERRLFRLLADPGLDRDSADSPVIEIVGQFDGRLGNDKTKNGSFGKAIDFTLSNRGDATVFVDRLWLTVLDSGECSWYSFPVGLRIPMKPIKYETTINSTASDYVLTEDMFKYGRGELDCFSLQVKAEEGLWYRVKVNARWFKEGVSGQKSVVATREHVIGFPRTINCIGLLANARKLDIQINPGALVELRQLPQLAGDSTRILVPGSSYYSPTFFEQFNLSKTGGNFRPTGEGVEWRVPMCTGADFQRLRHQYIIIDDSVVLYNYRELYGLVLRDPAEVKTFRQGFEASWDSPTPFDTADQMISTLRDRENPERLRALAAYNLRHFADPKGIAVLADAVSDPSEKVNNTAKASLQILGSSEITSVRGAVASIVFEKCSAAPAKYGAGGQWMKEYLKKMQHGN